MQYRIDFHSSNQTINHTAILKHTEYFLYIRYYDCYYYCLDRYNEKYHHQFWKLCLKTARPQFITMLYANTYNAQCNSISIECISFRVNFLISSIFRPRRNLDGIAFHYVDFVPLCVAWCGGSSVLFVSLHLSVSLSLSTSLFLSFLTFSLFLPRSASPFSLYAFFRLHRPLNRHAQLPFLIY